jgi:hypothetical protein
MADGLAIATGDAGRTAIYHLDHRYLFSLGCG